MKKLITAALLVAACSAQATDYVVVVPIPGRTSNVQLALNSTTLPDGSEFAAYPAFDFSQLLRVTGDPAFAASSVAWKLSAGTLPAGFALTGTGVLSGTAQAPSVVDFTVQATYKSRTAEQGYHLVLTPESDPYWKYVGYLFNFEGAPGAKALGEPLKGAPATFSGNAQLVASARFGQTSLSVAGGNVQLPGALLGVGTADFTYETYIQAAALGGWIQSLDCRPSSTNGAYATTGINKDGSVAWYVKSRDIVNSGPNAVTDTGWHHLAYSRSSGVGRLFLDGRLQGANVDTTNYLVSNACFVGKNAFGVALTGANLDATRVTVGVGRYTAAFTPPQRAYPTH